MKITYLSNTDLTGRIFNGYDLHLSLNGLGHSCAQIVIDKQSDTDTVIPLLSDNERYVREKLKKLERELSIHNLLYPYKDYLIENEHYLKPDILHCQLIHNAVLSMYDIEELFSEKKTVWALHDPWIFTGHCVYPLECSKWKEGCKSCPRPYDSAFPMKADISDQLWKVKRDVLEKADCDLIVSTDFMLNFVNNSPFASRPERVHKIPFGIAADKLELTDKISAKHSFGIDHQDLVVAFRAEGNTVKGLACILEALGLLDVKARISLLTVGYAPLPPEIKSKYNTVELGWTNDTGVMGRFYSAADIFLMPSLAESFGLMAIEAMAYECPVIVFENTVLPEITFAPLCGLAVKYKSGRALKDAVEYLISDPEDRIARGRLGRELVFEHYRYSDYVNKHLELYEAIMKR